MIVAGDLMSTHDVAEHLGISVQRVKRLVALGKLPEPVRVSDRAHVHRRVDIEVYQDSSQGQPITVLGSLAADAGSPLRRVVDTLVRAPQRWWFLDEVWLHVRVWKGCVGDVERTVVLLSVLHPSADVLRPHMRLIAPWIDAEILEGQGLDALWLIQHNRTPSHPSTFTNVVLRAEPPQAAHSGMRAMLRGLIPKQDDVWTLSVPSFHDLASVHEVDRLVGEPVEQFPGETYTSENVERWQRTRTPVPVTTDPYGLLPLAQALHVISRATGSNHRETAGYAMRAITDQLRETERAARRQHESPAWIDRAREERGRSGPEQVADLDAAHLAVWMTAIGLTEFDHAVMDDAGAPLPVDQLVTTWNGLWDWVEEVDGFADTPDPELATALDRAITAVETTMRAEGVVAPQRHSTLPRVAMVYGATGRRYLDQIAWQPPQARRNRRHRMLARRLRGGENARFGLDPDGRLVAHNPDVNPDLIATEWLRNGTLKLWDSASAIVADNPGEKPGALAVYLDTPQGLRLVPSDRAEFTDTGWQFGYGGSSPARLAYDLAKDYVQAHRLPTTTVRPLNEWFDRHTVRTATHLEIPVIEIRNYIAGLDG
ncbi:helix-turn-helix transcriptional regulator [Nocardia tengchongensis]|uniref:helix-turn-helix transcriptional regulator n=1 Tax=Nocardia tengchongensis TaxID=2055889 RepID=UPI0036C4CD74